MELSELKGKQILIVGLAKTGVSLARFLVKYGAQVTISDHKSSAELARYLEQVEDLPLKLELEGHNPKSFLNKNYVILSPGVPSHLKLFEYVKAQGVEVTGEFEFCSRFVKSPLLVVTGTNGKTTTADLIYKVLKESGKHVWAGGNFGKPLSEYLYKNEKSDFLVVEASSFMLEHVKEMTPRNIVFTNLAEDHLDRYRSMEEYVNAKRKIFQNVSDQTVVILNADDKAILELARDPCVQKGCLRYFSRKKSLESQIIMKIGGAILIGNQIRVRISQEIEYYSIENSLLKGGHSYENIMAAILIARINGANWESAQKVISSYAGRPHRLNYVRKVGGVKFYNDSKATNVHAVMKALDVFEDNVILIMGGKDTDLNYKPLAELIRKKVKNLILVGEAKERLNRQIGDYSETFLIGTFEEAVLIAYQKSRIGDTVLLSPGCPSFDIFNSFEERGNLFTNLVNQFH